MSVAKPNLLSVDQPDLLLSVDQPDLLLSISQPNLLLCYQSSVMINLVSSGLINLTTTDPQPGPFTVVNPDLLLSVDQPDLLLSVDQPDLLLNVDQPDLLSVLPSLTSVLATLTPIPVLDSLTPQCWQA